MPRLSGRFQVASWEDKVLIKVEGYATSNNSLFFQEFAEQTLSAGYRDFIIDLSECQGMDSTFLGVLVGILMRESGSEFQVTLVNATESHCRTLDSLGISEVLTILKSPIPIPELSMKTLQEDYYTPHRRLQMIREAHEALVKLNEQNRESFSGFLEILKAEMEKE